MDVWNRFILQDKSNKKISLDILKRKDLVLANFFKSKNLNKLIFTSIGNSIATGFSLSHNIKPLLLRNIYLEEILKNNDIEYECYGFSRPQDNNDEHILDWIINNKKLSSINKLIQIDLGDTDRAMRRANISKENLEKYYPLRPEKDYGLQDLIKTKDNGIANIVIYNGLTGSFLDNLTRKGEKIAVKRIC